MLSRSAILTDAHRRCRWAREQVVRIRGTLDPYRITFAWCLREAWRAAHDNARAAVAAAALSALEEAEADYEMAATPRNVVARVTALRRFAETFPLTTDGRLRRRTLLIEADDLAQAARCFPVPAFQDHAHAAH